jgi:ankyrin repeat protein
MVRFLVEGCGADVNAAVHGGEGVLSVACRMGLVEVVRVLVGMREGVEVDGRMDGSGSGGGQTALHVAVVADRAECVEVLVREGGADVDAVFDAAALEEGGRQEGGKGLRGMAMARGRGGHRRDGVRRLRNPVAALHLASASYVCTRVLLECGAAVDVRDGHGRTPLHRAAEVGNADVVRLLVGAGADVGAVANDETTSLAVVVGSLEDGNGGQGHVEILRLLLEKGADLKLKCEGKASLQDRLLGITVWSGKEMLEEVWEARSEKLA